MYQIKVNGEMSFAIDKDSLETFDVVQTDENLFHILYENASVKAKILNSDFNKKSYRIKIHNNTYEIEIKDALDQLISEMGFSLNSSQKIDSIKAPMPGLILEINVTPGEEVKEDDALLILEAMKMENVITSPRDGIIKSIEVNQSDTVDKNALLIEFE